MIFHVVFSNNLQSTNQSRGPCLTLLNLLEYFINQYHEKLKSVIISLLWCVYVIYKHVYIHNLQSLIYAAQVRSSKPSMIGTIA